MARHLRQEDRKQADRRQEGADLVDERDRGVVCELAEHRGTEAADAEATPKNTPEIMPKRCGTSSCANTMIDVVVDAMMRPMNTLSTALPTRPA